LASKITATFLADLATFIEGMKMQGEKKDEEQKQGSDYPAAGELVLL
jgi:hypothetical protein